MMITAPNTLSQLQKQMDVIGHNVANVRTNGYKARTTTFTDLLFQQFETGSEAAREVGRLSPNGVRQGVGAKVAQAQVVMTQGSLENTGRALDLALTKEGQFFRVSVQHEAGREIQYTRDGAFYLTTTSENEVMMVTSSGHPILDENNELIVINGQAKEYRVDESGTINVHLENDDQQVFQLGVSQVEKPQFLELKGNNLLGVPTNMGELNVGIEEIVTDLTDDQVSLKQGALEKSNVDAAKEMTDLIGAQRLYQFQARSINMADQMMGLINGIR
ncbi:flagellar hook-basal body protein [Niallia sp. XMNu-256]|uniref:flagellar hook-basal body protein n=1 Tax=Niallia sp. XMNu-256 TaxID=3082444 RepID=UPI0030D5FA7E